MWQTSAVNWLEENQVKAIRGCVGVCAHVGICISLGVHEYQINAANKGTADTEYDLTIRHSGRTGPFYISCIKVRLRLWVDVEVQV